MIFGVIVLLRRSIAGTATFCALCLLALGAQLVDSRHRYSTQDVALMALMNPHRPLRAREWRGVGRDYREIRLIPPSVVDTSCDRGRYPRFHYMPFAFLAGLEGMRVNSGHLSRYPSHIEDLCRSQVEEIQSGHLDPTVVYVIDETIFGSVPLLSPAVATCGRLDGYIVCVSSERDTALAASLARQE